ncbi:MAG: response regulator [Proteobacteria bacterium]|nr:MAG: response regulator [Pseudomonadota bacterium]
MFKKLKTVLIADDSPDFLLMFKLLLAPYKLDILTAENGVLAIEILKVNAVDLIITDFQMPQINGLGVLQWCRKNDIFCPVIFVTTDAIDIKSVDIILGDCCATLLKKPMDLEVFRAALFAADSFNHHEHCVHKSFRIAIEEAGDLPKT